MSLSKELVDLEDAVRREKAAPELLKYNTDVIVNVVELLEYQQQIYENSAKNAEDYFKMCIIQMDVDRIKYLLSTYLRTRLYKMQQYVFYIVQNDLVDLLSPQECEFIENYYKLKTNNFVKCFTMYLPTSLTPEFRGNISQEESQMMGHPAVPPNMEQFVVVKVREDVGNVGIMNAVVDLKQNEIRLIPYGLAKELMESKLVDLF
jgi:GINS complex subunit 4